MPQGQDSHVKDILAPTKSSHGFPAFPLIAVKPCTATTTPARNRRWCRWHGYSNRIIALAARDDITANFAIATTHGYCFESRHDSGKCLGVGCDGRLAHFQSHAFFWCWSVYIGHRISQKNASYRCAENQPMHSAVRKKKQFNIAYRGAENQRTHSTAKNKNKKVAGQQRMDGWHFAS